MPKRIQRLNELIKRELSKIILETFSFPDQILVTLTRVRTSSDLSQTKVYLSIIPEEKSEEILNTVKKDLKKIQQRLSQRLEIKKTPEIKIEKEEKTKKADKIEQILEEIKKDKDF